MSEPRMCRCPCGMTWEAAVQSVTMTPPEFYNREQAESLVAEAERRALAAASRQVEDNGGSGDASDD